MDYVEQLRREAQGSHAVFHQFALTVSTADRSTLFFFFEGDDDPAFYMPHISPRLQEREFHTLVCHGRTEVLKSHELVARDGRGTGRTLFFIDKDHSDIMGSDPKLLPGSVYQTQYYSIENYLLSDAAFRRFWVERLHLPDTDSRYQQYLATLQILAASFARKSRLLMSVVLLGRGINGCQPIKLNLNNVQLERIFSIDLNTKRCQYKPGALAHFLAASNIGPRNPLVTSSSVRNTIRRYLYARDPKTYIRGKYEAWFYWKILTLFSRQLSDRSVSRSNEIKRATPNTPLSLESIVESLAPMTPCPPCLSSFLATYLTPAFQSSAASSA